MKSNHFDPEADFFALTTFRFNSREYNRGDEFKPTCIDVRKLALLYDFRKIGYKWNLATEIKPLEKEQIEVKKPVAKKKQKPAKKTSKNT